MGKEILLNLIEHINSGEFEQIKKTCSKEVELMDSDGSNLIGDLFMDPYFKNNFDKFSKY